MAEEALIKLSRGRAKSIYVWGWLGRSLELWSWQPSAGWIASRSQKSLFACVLCESENCAKWVPGSITTEQRRNGERCQPLSAGSCMAEPPRLEITSKSKSSHQPAIPHTIFVYRLSINALSLYRCV